MSLNLAPLVEKERLGAEEAVLAVVVLALAGSELVLARPLATTASDMDLCPSTAVVDLVASPRALVLQADLLADFMLGETPPPQITHRGASNSAGAIYGRTMAASRRSAPAKLVVLLHQLLQYQDQVYPEHRRRRLW